LLHVIRDHHYADELPRRAPFVAYLRRGERIRRPSAEAGAMEQPAVSAHGNLRECPECGAKTRLYRTPRGLRCGECVREQDSGGLSFR
jgi:hypothetical protein